MNRYPEYQVITECGRNFVWSALDEDHLLRDLEYRGYKPLLIRPFSEYEAEMFVLDEQRKLNFELEEAASHEAV